MRWRGSIVCVGILALGAPVGAQERTGAVERVTSDLASRDFAAATDIVILSEGYTSDEEALFRADGGKLVLQARTDPDWGPLREGRPLNLHLAFVSARDRGAPWQPGRPARDTPCGASVRADGQFDADAAKADALAARLAPDVDCVVVLTRFTPEVDPTWTAPVSSGAAMLRVVNTPGEVRANADGPTWGSRVRIPATDTDAFLHELGHALHGLGDEYEEHERELPAADRWVIASYPNLTLDPGAGRWADIVATPPIEGGGCWAKGVWRPQASCRMRESRSEAFCAVCTALIRGPRPVVPAAPALLTPGRSARAPLAGGRLRYEVTWRHESASLATRPISFSVEVRGDDQKVLFQGNVDGNRRSAPIDVPAAAGSCSVMIRAVGVAGSSTWVWGQLEVLREPTAGRPTLGLVERLRGAARSP